MLKGLKLRQRYNNSISFRYLSIASIFLLTIQLNSIIEISKPIQSEDEHLGEIRLGYSWQTANEELIKAGLYNLYTAVLISSLFIGLTIIIFNRQILKPIQKLQQLAQAIAADKLDARVEVEGEDELGKLSSSLNDYLFIRKSFISHC